MIWPIAIPIVAGILALCTPRGLGRYVKWFAVAVTAAIMALWPLKIPMR